MIRPGPDLAWWALRAPIRARLKCALVALAVGAAIATLATGCGGASGSVAASVGQSGGTSLCAQAGSHCASDVECCSGRCDPRGGILRRRGAHQLRGRRRSVHHVARVLLALVRGRAVRDASLCLRRARMHFGRRLLRRNVLGGNVQGAEQRMQDLGQHVRTELRVLLAALRVGSLLDRIVVLHPERRHVRARPRLLRRRLHDGRRRVGGYLQRTARRGDVLQRRRRRDGVQRMRRVSVAAASAPCMALRREGLPTGRGLSHRRRPSARRTRTAAELRGAVCRATATSSARSRLASRWGSAETRRDATRRATSATTRTTPAPTRRRATTAAAPPATRERVSSTSSVCRGATRSARASARAEGARSTRIAAGVATASPVPVASWRARRHAAPWEARAPGARTAARDFHASRRRARRAAFAEPRHHPANTGPPCKRARALRASVRARRRLLQQRPAHHGHGSGLRRSGRGARASSRRFDEAAALAGRWIDFASEELTMGSRSVFGWVAFATVCGYAAGCGGNSERHRRRRRDVPRTRPRGTTWARDRRVRIGRGRRDGQRRRRVAHADRLRARRRHPGELPGAGWRVLGGERMLQRRLHGRCV